MPVPFGVSVGMSNLRQLHVFFSYNLLGDFIAVIGAFTKVCKALKASGGAVDEYQQTITQLQRMQVIIEQVEKLQIASVPSHGTDIASIVNALCG